MKKKIKYKVQIYIVKFLVLFGLALTLSNCQVEEEIDKKESNIQTVGINDAVSFLKQNPINSSKTGKNTLLLPDITAISQEKIKNSDQLLTVIPLSTNNKEEYSRILMSRINGVLRVVVFSMYSDKDNVTEKFSGKIMIRNLNGDFLNGFRVENGIYVSQFQILKTEKNITKREGGEETPSNGGQLNEVPVNNPYRRPNAATPWLYLYNDLDDSRGGYGDYSWDSGSGGGGGEGFTPPNTDEADPCAELKKQNTNPNFKSKIDELSQKTNLKKETGYMQSKNGPLTALTNLSNDSMRLPYDANTVGYMHTHLDDYDSGTVDENGNTLINQPIKMFSPADVESFMILLVNANKNGIPLSDIYGTMISSKGNYSLRFEGAYSDLNLGLNFKELNKGYVKIMNDNISKELGFLKFMKENGITGISLFKINNDGSTAQKTLDVKEKLTTTPCP
ncbi:hypothetical protein OIU80_20610 [Flavobacterium sp. LS1R47]|uniref:Lipoprotein n=1 Tax=Flavobacterium frigoritolerans TaxID=2987686 RepID=A0A9X3CAJ5_9FLAO|nr:hypothetical protein [Flavobacterium frigoritolerans]MCV9934690.1 hypothetical protein [Flavobacterium frigoritolerans]